MGHEINIWIKKTQNGKYVIDIPKEGTGTGMFSKKEFETYSFSTYQELSQWLKNKTETL